MVLLLDNDVTQQTLEMPDALNALENAFRQIADDEAAFRQLSNIWFPTQPNGDTFRYGDQLSAMLDPPRVAIRLKSDIRRIEEGREIRFNVEPGLNMRFVLLFDASDGELLALLNDRDLQRTRVGGTAGLAGKYLARPGATTVGMIGAGAMARAYARAFASVRDISRITVYSPTSSSREGYAKEMSEELNIDVVAVDNPQAAVEGADIVSTCTNAEQPVIEGEWLEPGQFVANTRAKEIGDDARDRFDKVVIGANEPYTQYTVGDVERSMSENRLTRTDYPELAEIVAANDPRPADDAIVFFENRSVSIQFVALCNLIHERAVEEGLGTTLPLEWFQQEGA